MIRTFKRFVSSLLIVCLAGQIESLPAGGADVLGVLLIVFLVLLLTDILGFTKIFPFTRSIR